MCLSCEAGKGSNKNTDICKVIILVICLFVFKVIFVILVLFLFIVVFLNNYFSVELEGLPPNLMMIGFHLSKKTI